MGILANLKAAFSTAQFFAASVMDGFGTNGARARPFNADLAFRQFSHWAYAAGMLNANAVANVCLRLYARQRSGSSLYQTRKLKSHELKAISFHASNSVRRKIAEFGSDVVEVTEPHPILEVQRTVNGQQNGYELTVLRMIDLQFTGNSYQYLVSNNLSVPSEIWRMEPQKTSIISDKKSWVKGYVYGLPPNEQTFPAEDVIHFRLPNPTDPNYGRGWVQAAWESIGLHNSKRTMDLAKFDNMGRPDWLLTIKSGAKQEALDLLEKRMKEKFAGRNQGRMLTLGSDAELKALQWDTPEVGTPTRIIEEISAVSGVPVAMLLSNDPAKGNSEPARVGWYRNTIRPYCRLDEEKLNEKWVPLFDGAEDYFVAYDLVSFEDEAEMSKRVIGLVAGGVLTPNEGRAEIGYSPMEGGDRLLPPTGSTGGAAAVAGDQAVNQNDERQNEAEL